MPPEPTSSIAMTVTASAILTIAGVSTGLRPEQLLAGFGGALAAILLLDSVPSTGDTLRELLRTTARRVGVAVGSAVTAGYVGQLVGVIDNVLPPPLLMPKEFSLGIVFVVGAGAKRVLAALIDRSVDKARGTNSGVPAKPNEEASQ